MEYQATDVKTIKITPAESSLRKLYVWNNDLVSKYYVSLRHMLTDVFYTCLTIFNYLYTGLCTVSGSWQWAHGWCDLSAGNAYSSYAPDPTSILLEVGVCSAIYLFFAVFEMVDSLSKKCLLKNLTFNNWKITNL